jgi:3-deoxy-D-manno-octulosonic-acid transferase
LAPIGGHNILEPAGMGIAVVHGPHMHNFLVISQMMAAAGATLMVDSASLSTVVLALLDDPVRRQSMGQKGQDVVHANQGATRCTQTAIEQLLAQSGLLAEQVR